MSVSLIKVSAPWMRAAILTQALAQGFTWSQVATNTDQYTKGTKVITVSWSNVVTGATIQEGKGSPKTLAAGHQGKLQIITTALGHKAMTVTQKWSASDLFIQESKDGQKNKASTEELKALAVATFKPMAK